MNILVLDVGTSGMKAELKDCSGRTLFRASRGYQPRYAPEGLVEQDPGDWLSTLTKLTAEAARVACVGALALTCQRSSVIAADAEGKALRPAIMWQDTRNAGLCRQIGQKYGSDIRRISGSSVNTVYSGGKMAWLRQNEPACYGAAHKLVTIADYLIWHMTGHLCTDDTYASRSLLMDLKTRDWSPELLELFGLEREKLCDIAASGTVVGTVTETFARMGGIDAGIPVVSCGGDQQCAALGQGASGPGALSVNLGTGAYLAGVAGMVPEHLPEGIVCNTFPIPGCYVLEIGLPACCAGVNWMLRQFFPGQGIAPITSALRDSSPGAGGVCVRPDFQGRFFPSPDPDAGGVIAGLSLSATREDLLRALLEGIACEIAEGADAMACCAEIRTVRVSGGLAKNDGFCALLADVLGRTIVRSGTDNATAAGAWSVAATALGLSADCEHARKMLETGSEQCFRPDGARNALYRELRKKQRLLGGVGPGREETNA